MMSDHLGKTRVGALELYQKVPASYLIEDQPRPTGQGIKFIKIKSNQHNFEVYLRILLLLSPLIILFIRVYFYNIPLMLFSSRLVPGSGLNMILFGLSGACFLPLLFIIGHDENIMTRLNEQWCLILKDEIIFVEKYYSRIFVPFNQSYYIHNFSRIKLRHIEFIAKNDWRRAGGTCFNPDVAARFISWEIAIQAENISRIDLGDISFNSVAELHRLIKEWLPEGADLKPLPTDPVG